LGVASFFFLAVVDKSASDIGGNLVAQVSLDSSHGKRVLEDAVADGGVINGGEWVQ
jgi:hypothetical protein